MTTTSIQDTVTYFDGSVASGQIVVTWPPFSYAGVAIAAGQKVYPIAADGSVQIDCYPCVGAQPLGIYYTATYELDEGSVYDEYWLVPATPTTTIGAIRATAPSSPSIMINANQLTGGGASPGMLLGWNGSSWTPMFVSNFNAPVRSWGLPGAGRIGDVQPKAGDYTVSQITGAVPQTTQIIAGPGLSGGGPLSGNVTLSLAAGGFVPPTTQIIAGYGLSGGGPLSGNVTLSVTTGIFALQTTQIIVGSGLSGGGPLSGNVNIGVIAGAFVLPTTQVIAGSGLSGGGALSGNVTLSLTPGAFVPPTTQVIAGSGLSGGGPLSANVTLSAVAMGASGPGHAAGIVPDPGATAGTTRFLREDATWVVIVSGVSSFNGRSGAVVPVAGDYPPAFIGAVPTTRQVLAGAGLTGGGLLSADVSLAWPGVQTAIAGAFQGTEPELNFIAGPGTTLSVNDVPTGKRVDITIGVSGTGPPSNSIYAINGAAIGTRPELNLISGASIALTGADNPIGRVDITVAATVFGASGAAHAAGTVPDPGATAGTTRYLREDGTWGVPPGAAGGVSSISPGLLTGAVTFAGGANISVTQSGQTITIAATGVVTSVFGRSGAVVAQASDYSAYYVSLTGSYASPSWLTQINWSIISGVPAGVGSPLTTKGDIYTFSTVNARLAVGANNTMLIADSTQATGNKWAVPTASMITNAVDSTQAYPNPGWLTSLAWGKITGAPAFLTTAVTSLSGLTGAVTLVAGSNITITPSGQNLTIAATGFLTTAVTSLSGLTGAVTLVAGTNITITPSGQNLTIASTGGGGTPAGSTGQVQYNNAGAFGASPNLYWDNADSWLGIGTGSPFGELVVASTSTTNALRGIVSLQVSNSVHGGQVSLLKARGTVSAPTVVQAGDYLGGVNFAGYVNGAYSSTVALLSPVTGVSASAISADLTFILSAGERMRITSAGNVGINTTTPQGNLEVCCQTTTVGTAGMRGLVSSEYYSGPHSACLWLVKGRGTAVAPAPVQVGDSLFSILDMGVTTGGTLVNGTNFNSVVTAVGTGTLSADLVFGTAGVERMRITSAGNVGIGTTTPNYMFAVSTPSTWVPQTTAGLTGIGVGVTGAYGGGIGLIDGAQTMCLFSYAGNLHFGNGTTSGVTTPRMVLGTGGGVQIGGLSVGPNNPGDLLVTSGLGPSGYGAIRMIYGNYGVFFRNDGSMFYVMTTNSGDQYGVWKGPYPISIDLASNCVGIRAGATATYGLSVDSINCQSLWINGVSIGAGAGSTFLANSSAQLSLTTGWGAIPGCSTNVSRAGRYMVTGHFWVLFGTSAIVYGTCAVNGGPQNSGQTSNPGGQPYQYFSMSWIFQLNANDALALYAYNSVTGSNVIYNAQMIVQAAG